jgi:uncharacterized repeat protein (TIGR01451 family)
MGTAIARLLPALFALSFSSSPHRLSRWAGGLRDVMTTLPLHSACRSRMARIVLRGCALALAILAVAALPLRANAQTFSASKNLCIGNPGTGPNQVNPIGCPQAYTVGAGQQVFYVITVTNLPGGPAQPITVNENLPTGFSPTAVVCTDQSGNPVISTGSLSAFIFTLGQNPNGGTWTVTCTIAGTFPNAVSGVSNTATLTGSDGTAVQTNTVNTFVAPMSPLNTHLKVDKTESNSTVTLTGTPPSAPVTYTITITNNTGQNGQPPRR